MGWATYVDDVKTIPAGGSFTTYYYQPSSNFTIGFIMVDGTGDTVTTRNRSVKLTINKFKTIGGTASQVKTATYSTNIEDNECDPNPRGNMGVSITTDSISSTYSYYNGVYKNMSSSSMDIHIVVTMD